MMKKKGTRLSSMKVKVSSKVVIVGAGALGKCLAALLAEKVCVTVYERDRSALQELQKHGFKFKEGNRVRDVRVKIVPSLKALRSEKIDVLIFATKVMALPGALRASTELKPRCVFLPQNGLFDINGIKRSFKNAVVCRGVTTMACQESTSGTAQLLYRGQMYVDRRAADVARLFRRAGLKVVVSENSDGFIFAKLIFNAVMNPLPVITGKGYGILKTNHTISSLAQAGIREGLDVAKALNIRLAFDPMKFFLRVKEGDLVGLPYKGSMFQDVAMKRKTEIDFITGALVRTARQAGVPVPALKFILAKAKAVGA